MRRGGTGNSFAGAAPCGESYAAGASRMISRRGRVLRAAGRMSLEVREVKLCRTNEWMRGGLVRGLVVAVCALPALALAAGGGAPRGDDGPCSLSAEAARIACGHEADDDYFIAVGKCLNMSDASERTRCNQIAARRHADAPEECNEVF